MCPAFGPHALTGNVTVNSKCAQTRVHNATSFGKALSPDYDAKVPAWWYCKVVHAKRCLHFAPASRLVTHYPFI